MVDVILLVINTGTKVQPFPHTPKSRSILTRYNPVTGSKKVYKHLSVILIYRNCFFEINL
ncbi:MAG: hypothetical protein A2Y87_02590 [Bacteroidetes bacterium RBG_13_46_8]|nr:MAG: hypothetical protein A2Y87_02590 [Bacteroidetes bacterium RBG_13_46_8]